VCSSLVPTIDILRNGGATAWTEAFYPAINYVRALNADQICIAEWGFFDNTRLFGRGKLQLAVANDPAESENDRQFAQRQIENQRNFFITHTKGNEIEPGRTERIVRFAQELGYKQANLHVFADSNGRPIIEVFSFEPGR